LPQAKVKWIGQSNPKSNPQDNGTKPLRKFDERDLVRLKGNCPSGYRCRTRHPQGLGYPLSRVFRQERGGSLVNVKKGSMQE
jgi:hypothetical protein